MITDKEYLKHKNRLLIEREKIKEKMND